MLKLQAIKVAHTIPNIGPVEVPLFEPADSLYEAMRDCGEVERLQGLRHLGVLEQVFPGVTHSRWDYTVSMLYVVSHDRSPGMKTSIRLGELRFSSAIAATQCAVLLSNIGHLPGTFAVEKGVARYLCHNDPRNPLEVLPWADVAQVLGYSTVVDAKRACTEYFLASDYLGLNRVLAIWKALHWAVAQPLRDLLVTFWVPFVCKDHRPPWRQWRKIDRCYEFARRLAYLNLDSVFCDLPVASPAAPLIRRMVRGDGRDELTSLEDLKTLLAAYERAVFHSLYHSPRARVAVALVAQRVFEKLKSVTQPEAVALITGWLTASPPDLGDRSLTQLTGERLAASATARVCSLFVPSLGPIAQYEEDLAKKIKTSRGASILVFPSWEGSATHLEPDEVYVDVIGRRAPDTRAIGRLIVWLGRQFDWTQAREKESFWLYVKNDLVPTYRDLLAQAIAALYDGVELELNAWPLAEFGLWKGQDVAVEGLLWLADGKRRSPVLQYMSTAARPTGEGTAAHRWYELMGVLDLVSSLQRAQAADTSAYRLLVLTCSIVLKAKGSGKHIMEFDGGVVRIHTRSGRMVFYGLETRSSETAQACCNDLKRRLRKLARLAGPRRTSLLGPVKSINPHSACAQIRLY